MSRAHKGWMFLGGLLVLGCAGCANHDTSTASTPAEKKQFFNAPAYKDMSPEARKMQDAFSHHPGGPTSGPPTMPPPTKP